MCKYKQTRRQAVAILYTVHTKVVPACGIIHVYTCVKYTPEVLSFNQNGLSAHVQIRLELLCNAKENPLFCSYIFIFVKE
jgi:hypothetical protein